MRILVFPSVVDGAHEFAYEASRYGCTVFGASSTPDNDAKSVFAGFSLLAFTTSKTFWSDLRQICVDFKIDALFTPHAATRVFLERNIDMMPNGVKLFGDGPIQAQTFQVVRAWDGIERKLERIEKYGCGLMPYSRNYIASLLARFHQIYGECQEEKVLALCGITSKPLVGDVVEIGCLFGKSAYVLNQLAQYHGIGATICVDPFNIDAAIQHDASEYIKALTRSWDGDVIYLGFMLTMGTAINLHHLRFRSDEAFEMHRAARRTHKIAILHIDGNHDEAQVRRDWRKWGSLIAQDAWIIFDDYIWSHGDGPRVVADEAIEFYGSHVKRRFVAGGAMFMQIVHDK